MLGLSDCWRLTQEFRDWPRLLADYAAVRKPADRYRLRSGRLIRTHARDRLDAATLAVVFGKRDYGLPDPGVVLDVGANIGAFAALALERGCDVHAVEPDPSNFLLLKQNAPEAHLMPVALGDRDERRLLYLRAGPSHSLYARGPEPSIEVDCLALSGLLGLIGGVDLLKLDVEGAEYEILYAAHGVLDRIGAIRMEYHHMLGDSDESRQIRRLLAYLHANGFHLERFAPISHMSGIAWLRRSRHQRLRLRQRVPATTPTSANPA